MKNKKLKLEQLKVQSFVTALKGKEKQTILGGENTEHPACRTEVAACQLANSRTPFCPPPFTCGRPDSLCPPPLDTELQCV